MIYQCLIIVSVNYIFLQIFLLHISHVYMQDNRKYMDIYMNVSDFIYTFKKHWLWMFFFFFRLFVFCWLLVECIIFWFYNYFLNQYFLNV